MNMPVDSRFKEAVNFLESLSNMRSGMLDKHSQASPSLYLKRTRVLLDELGLDLEKMKFVHIAGTSGKGSVSNLVYQQLLKRQKKTGLFTSPFVTSTIEKIEVNGKYIDPKVFAMLTDKLKDAIDRVYNMHPYGCPSYFECITAIALMHFVDQKCEYAVIETGLGGRYDSTNILPKPLVTAITNIDLDHTDILGNTLEKIAYEKAGIIKKGSIFYTTESRPVLLSLFKNTCKENKAAFNVANIAGMTVPEKNISLASAILGGLGFPFEAFHDSESLKLPARFETIAIRPHIIVDGAHNPAKMKSTSENWKSLKTLGRKILIVGMAANKDAKETLRHVALQADTIFITRFLSPFRKAMEPKDIEKIVRRINKDAKIKVILDPLSAFKEAQKSSSAHDSILVTGSFYLAGDIRSLYYPESFILKNRRSK